MIVLNSSNLPRILQERSRHPHCSACRDAQDRLLKDKACPAQTQLIINWKALMLGLSELLHCTGFAPKGVKRRGGFGSMTCLGEGG